MNTIKIEIPFFGKVSGRLASRDESDMALNHLRQIVGTYGVRRPDPRYPILESRNLCCANQGDFQAVEHRLPSSEGLIKWRSLAGGWGGAVVVPQYGVVSEREADPCANL